jgi:hypothetical protein
MWILKTQQTGGAKVTAAMRRKYRKWDPVRSGDLKKLLVTRGSGYNIWYWVFKNKAAALKGREIIKERNRGLNMRLYLRNVTELPDGRLVSEL